MKGFYWGKGVVRCSFCGYRHHNITSCKIVDRYADLALDKIAKIPSYICSPHEHKALLELKKREERKAKMRKPKKQARCSYCNCSDHKRPKCKHLKQFRHNVYKANKNWKTLLSKRINEVGLGIGSLIKLDGQAARSFDFGVEANHIAMITKYNLNNLNVFCALGDTTGRYQSNTTFQILSGDKTDDISVKYLGYLLGYDLMNVGWWYQSGIPKVLNPMPWEPDDEWIENEWDEVLDWFFNDIILIDVINNGLNDFINDWANKI